MRKLKFSIIGIITSLFLCSCLSHAEESHVRASNALVIEHAPNKTLYDLGETFTSEGLSVIDLSGHEVFDYTSSYTDGQELNQEGDFNVYLTKRNYVSASYKITVKDMHHLVVKSEPIKVTYQVGDYFSTNGLEVTDELGNEVTDYNLSYRVGNILKTSGMMDILVSKTDYVSTSFQINVESDKQLVVKHMPNKTTYNVGDAFDSTGLVIGDNKGNNDLAYTLSIHDGSILKYTGSIPVQVNVEGYPQISFNITVKDSGGHVSGEDKTIDIYYMNDTHGSFSRNADDKEAGIAYISSYLKEHKTDTTLVLSGGDMLQGGIESNATKGKIMIEAMNVMGFDAMALGNHEFDWGEETLIDTMNLANFPLLSCNTFYSYDKKTRPSWVTPYTVIEKSGVTIGIIGFARYNMGSSISGSIANNFYFPSPESYIKSYSTELRLSYNCDLVLAVGHEEGYEANSGDSYPTKFSGLTQNDSATGRKYVDGFMFAHDHYRKNGTYNGVPFMESACNAEYLGHMTFDLSSNGVGYQVTDTDVELINAYDNCLVEDKEVTDLVSKYADYIQDPEKVLINFKNEYTREEFTVITAHAMVWYVNKNKDIFKNVTVYLGTHNITGIRVYDIPRGPFTLRDLVEACPFDNALCIQNVTESQYNSLKRNSYYAYYEEGRPVYSNNITHAVTISYIAEYSSKIQQSYVAYPDYTAKKALMEYLQSSEASNL